MLISSLAWFSDFEKMSAKVLQVWPVPWFQLLSVTWWCRKKHWKSPSLLSSQFWTVRWFWLTPFMGRYLSFCCYLVKFHHQVLNCRYQITWVWVWLSMASKRSSLDLPPFAMSNYTNRYHICLYAPPLSGMWTCWNPMQVASVLVNIVTLMLPEWGDLMTAVVMGIAVVIAMTRRHTRCLCSAGSGLAVKFTCWRATK